MKSEFFKWKNEYELGSEEIDQQHHKLVYLINELFESFINKTSDEKLNDILSELINYSDYHFKSEEKFLEKKFYPKLDEHKALHLAFFKKIQEFKNSYNKGGKITITVMNFLRKWLNDHILKEDRDYMKFLNSKN